MSSDKLIARRISVRFAGIQALSDVSIELQTRSVVGLIGPNGAGKTTLLNVLSGFQASFEGTLELTTSRKWPGSPAKLARAGVVRTFQGARLFSGLTVYENVEAGLLAGARRARDLRSNVEAVLAEWNLTRFRDTYADALPYGEQRRLGMARAMASGPSFILLDEPAAGMDEGETAELAEVIASLPDRYGCGVLVVEHDMDLIMSVCEHIFVLDQGKRIASGDPDAIKKDPKVLASYLGPGEE